MSEIKINQSVILCGGLGTRLRPLTDNLPKPMVIVNGRPFLYHLLNQLSEKGITRFLLLTGYLGEKISEYFGNGSQFGWSITYSHGPVEWDTGRRIWEAQIYLDAQFLLLYSDNFVQFNFPKLKKLHEKMRYPITLLLAPKTRGNIKATEDGHILSYDKSRSGEGFDFVEVGYMIVEREEVLSELSMSENFPDTNFSTVIQNFSLKQKIAGMVVRDPYHSISDIPRFSLAKEYFSHKKILLIDRDGTINEKSAQGEYVTSWKDFKWISETREAMQYLASKGFKFIVITNQAGIARKMIDPEALEEIHLKMASTLKADGIEILGVYVCPDHWEAKSIMRKPAPGMFFQVAKEFNLRMDRCLYVGDDLRDCQAAVNAGCGMVYLCADEDTVELESLPYPYIRSKNFKNSMKDVEAIYTQWELRS